MRVDFVPAWIALKFGLVAEGNADIYPRLCPTMEWDTAAWQRVVEQNSGAVLDLMERVPLDYSRKNLLNLHFTCLGAHTRDFQW